MSVVDLLEAAAKRLSEPTDEDGFVYHGTTKKDLPAIKKNGLMPKPQKHRDEKRGVDPDEAALFFTVTPEKASHWGNVILRFPWPVEAEEDPYGETFIHTDGKAYYDNWYTFEAPAPETIEMWDGRKWKRL
jgi:hypothetical protein